MERRKFVVGLGALASGSAAAMGTGAFTSVEADRGINVDTASDANAFLGLQQVSGSPNSTEYTDTEGDTLTIFTPDDVQGSGFNLDATTRIDELFKIRNQSSQTQYVWLDLINSENAPEDEWGNAAGDRAVGFYVEDESGLQSISFGSAPEDPNNEDKSLPEGEKGPVDSQPLASVNTAPDIADSRGAVEIGTGSAVTVGLIVDPTRAEFIDEDGDGSAEAADDISSVSDLVSEAVVKAQAEDPSS